MIAATTSLTTVLALVAMFCGSMHATNSLNTQREAKACYKTMLLCVEHKQQVGVKADQAVKACILEY